MKQSTDAKRLQTPTSKSKSVSVACVACCIAMVLVSCEKKNSVKSESPDSGVGRPAVKGSVRDHPSEKFNLDQSLNQMKDPSSDPESVSAMVRQLEAMSSRDLLDLLDLLAPFGAPGSKELANEVLSALSVKDPKLTLDTLERLPGNVKMQRVCYSLMAESHPDIVLKWFSDHKDSASDHLMAAATGSLLKLCEVAPKETLKVFSQMNSNVAGYYLPMIVNDIVRMEPENAAKWVSEGVGDAHQNVVMPALVAALAGVNMEHSIRVLNSLEGEVYGLCVHQLLPALAGNPDIDVKPLLAKIPPAQLQFALSKAGSLEALVARNPEVAQSVISSLPYTEASKSLFGRYAISLAKNDPEKAMNYLQTLSAGQATSEITSKVFEAIATNNLEIAKSKVKDLPMESQVIAVRGMVRALARTDVDGALQIAAQSDPAGRRDVYREVARTLTYENTPRAIAMLENPEYVAVLGDDFRSQMIDHAVRNWGAKDLGAARDWVEKLNPKDQTKGIQGLMTPWMKTDPVAASEWLSKQPPGPARDAGARVLIEQIKNTDPQMADQWMRSLSP